MAAIGQSNLLLALGWAVFSSLWQMAILWIAYQLVVSVLKINRASQKSFLAVFLQFAGFAWFVFTFLTSFTGAVAAGESYTGLIYTTGNTVLANLVSTLLPVISLLYLVLLILPVLGFVRNYRYVQVIRRYGLSRADVEWRLFVQRIASGMGIRSQVHIWMSELVSSPVTIGYIKPVILLPIAAVNHLTTDQIEAVLLHELSHIRRRDYFINLLVRLIQTVLYFNPFVKAFTKIIGREREKSCDETVMQFRYEPYGYASALLALEKAAHIPQHSLTVGASDGKKSEFRQRIEWILGIRPKQVFSFTRLAGVLAALLCFVGLNAILIMKNPARVTTEPGYSYTSLPSTYEFLNDGYDKTTNASVAERRPEPVVNTAPPAKPGETAPLSPSLLIPSYNMDVAAGNPDYFPYSYVSHVETVVPQLNDAEELQVQKALEESKRVLQEVKWQEMEYNIADAMTTLEKEKAKEVYVKTFSGIDWQKAGDKLRLAYDQINWPAINAQLDLAITGIRLDSLQQVYTIALDNLSATQKELTRLNQPAIPDTDITVECIENRKTEIRKAISDIKIVRPKKIVRL